MQRLDAKFGDGLTLGAPTNRPSKVRIAVRGRGTTRSQSVLLYLLLALTVVSPLSMPQGLYAATAAYWRHEEGPSGQLVPDGFDTVLDSSGNGQHMQTFSSASSPFTAATYSPLVSPLPLRSGLPNNYSLDFGPNPAVGVEDGGGLNDDNFTQGKAIQTQLFTEMTVELAFNMNSIGGFQTLFGKDGKPLGDDPDEPDSPLAPLQIKIRGDDFPDAVPNQLQVEWIDGDGDIHFLASGDTITAGEWMHVAFTLTDTAAELWIAGETGDYALKDAISGDDFAGTFGEVTIFEPLGFSIGRGMFDNGVTDWSDALIDEVRVSDTALLPTDFLFVTTPGGVNGDYNGNGIVDGADYSVWLANLGASIALPGEDPAAATPGLVDLEDYSFWKSQLGNSSASASGSVPEPAGLALLYIAIGVIGWHRHRPHAWANVESGLNL